jgi:hypothetical protein
MKGPFFLWILFLLAPAAKVCAQSDSSMPRLTCDWPRHSKRHHIAYTPFGTFEVFDNRSDTTHVFTNYPFPRPPVACAFDTTASVAIRRYLEATAGLIKSGPETLLLRVQTLDLPNKGYYLYRPRANSSAIFARWRRNDLICEVQAYYKTENGYRKLFDATVQRFGIPFSEVPFYVADIFDELLESASIVYARDHGQRIRHPRYLNSLLRNSRYRYPDREKLFSVAGINQNMRLQWPLYPAFMSKPPGPGKYKVFEDFKAATTDHFPMQLSFDAVDSVYRVRYLEKDSNGTGDYWGISDGRDAYLKIGQNAFLKLARQDSTYVFFVPHTMPDIYTQFSVGNVGSATVADNFAPSSGNMLSDLGAILVVAAINAAINKHADKVADKERQQILNSPQDFGYRIGWLDMYSGDILFKKQ